MQTYSDVIFNTGDLIFYTQKDILNWRGPVSVIGRDGQEVLVKHGS